MGRAAIAVVTSGGSGGSKRMWPAASTPVETVTIAAPARMVPQGVSTATPVPPQLIPWAGVDKLTPVSSKRVM